MRIANFFKSIHTRATLGTTLLQQSLIREVKADILHTCPENLVQFGHSAYSQNEEDGIIQEIFKRLKVAAPTFIEFGVGLTENNSINLLLSGGKGAWVDKQIGSFRHQLTGIPNLHLIDDFITLENISSFANQSIKQLGLGDSKDLDLLSLDLDGNDFYFIEKLLQDGILPKLFCLEYNAKFSPPLNVKIEYNAQHGWQHDDYFGCSLQAYVDLMAKHDYSLLVCSLTGINCFFLRNDFKQLFKIYSTEDLYQPPRYHLASFHKGHKSTLKFLKKSAK